MTLAYHALSGQPGILVCFDWIRHCYIRVLAVDLGRPDRETPTTDILEREALPPGKRGPRMRGDPARNSRLVHQRHMQQVADLLAERGPLRMCEIERELGISYHSLGRALRQHPDRFLHSGCGESVRWSLVEPQTAI